MATLADLRTRVRERADMENSQFISDSELDSYINAGYYELYDLLVQTYEDYYSTSVQFTLTSSDSGVYALPATFYKLRGLEFQLGSDWVTLYPFNWNNRNLRQRAINRTAFGDEDKAYRLMGSNLRIEPNDNATGTYQLWYIPSLTALSAATDTVDTVMTRAGWEEYVVVDAAIRCLAKEESNTQHLLFEKQQLKERIETAAGDRDADQPERISDVTRRDGDWDWYGW